MRFEVKRVKSKNMMPIIKTTASTNQSLHSVKDHQMPFVGGPNTHITNSKCRTAAILEKIAISQLRFEGFRRKLAR